MQGTRENSEDAKTWNKYQRVGKTQLLMREMSLR